MKILTRVFSAIVLSLLVAAAGIVFSVRSQETSMKAQLQVVFDSYAQVVVPALNGLSGVELSVQEQQLVNRARELLTGTVPTDLSEKVQYISNFQQSLRALTVSLASHEELAQNPSLTVLKTETSSKGVVAPLLQAFNEKVLAWNQRDRSTIGQWIGSALHLEKVLMLNPDGKTELMPTVTM